MIFGATFIDEDGHSQGVVFEEGRSTTGDFGYEVGLTDGSSAYHTYLGFFADYKVARKVALRALKVLADQAFTELRNCVPFNERSADE